MQIASREGDCLRHEWKAATSIVMPREGGASSIRKRHGKITGVSDYWIVRLRG
jgi:hypothetical protein